MQCPYAWLSAQAMACSVDIVLPSAHARANASSSHSARTRTGFLIRRLGETLRLMVE